MDEREQAVVVDPHDADRREAGEEGQILRPLPQQRRAQPAEPQRTGRGHADLEHQQGDRDRVDAVAKGLDAAGFLLAAGPLPGRLVVGRGTPHLRTLLGLNSPPA